MKKAKAIVYKSAKDGLWYVRVVAANGRKLLRHRWQGLKIESGQHDRAGYLCGGR